MRRETHAARLFASDVVGCSETNDQDGGLIDEVRVELGPAERSGGSVQRTISQVELGDAG